MIHITSLDEGLELFKALGSDVRIQILNILLENGHMSMNQLATQLNLSNGALTGHIKKLEECGLISTSNESASHGNSKICSVIQDKIVLEIEKPVDLSNVFATSIKVGQFSSFNVCPTCGLADSSSVIGEIDDARYFSHPDRFNADIIWFTKGYVEYTLPNLVPSNNEITQISISFEISSEAPGVDENWPSDISFYLNDKKLGMWTSPGDFGGDILGMFTPDWWPQNWNQYGLLKLLVVNRHGTFIDGLKISDLTISDLALDSSTPINFRIAVDDDAEHVGGVTLFGKSFGNYGQDIKVSLSYMPKN
ncbi:ArsR/SmtB family transcription factor [Pseudobutyrivibrio sp.]|uniref:ArsR/SmtB family transcription factor n=1 Tax=Pseudobutyrivibrio sp. TaxID=2014367 RepID=UPI001E193B47|nr:winged helix-turn-helix transcriptional regulator [Pseudobutyrivibrio sp.]MBE5910255.1 winged helix-turn-helix transcriptional regulator [Pseudobutyrivibrio sp.]